MAEKPETRALTAALSGPAWTTRMGGTAMQAANRHVERWAPEADTSRVRSMRSLGFVDRLVAPWLDTAQRSAGLRMFSSAARSGGRTDRDTNHVSWVFPRPWFQDELDWMTAAREVNTETAASEARPSMLTTRGTYVAPQAQLRPAPVMPSALYEYVAPSLSIAQPASRQDRAFDAAPATHAYSPLISLAAVQAAELMSRAVAPLMPAMPAISTTAPTAPAAQTTAAAPLGRITPALRTVLTTMLERASIPTVPTQSSFRAPAMVTPPAPRADDGFFEAPATMTPAMTMATQVATDLHTERAQVAQLQAIAQRQADVVRAQEVQVVAQRAEAERQRTEQARVERPAPSTATPTTTVAPSASTPAIERAMAEAAVERARVEERVMQRVAERVASQRLHEQARAEAAVHARSLEERREEPAQVAAPAQPPAEILAAIAALPPHLAGALSANVLQQPGGALRAITQVNEALRTAELIARGAATNTTFEPTRGPRVMMPAGIGGLVAAVDRAHGPTMAPMMSMAAPSIAEQPAAFARQAERAYRVPTLSWVAPSTPTMIGSDTVATRTTPTSALGAAANAAPQGLAHVAWADRWLARFAGASSRSLDAMTATSSVSSFANLVSAAPQAVFVAPMFDGERAPIAATSMDSTGASSAPTTTERMPRLIPAAPPPMQRFDDSAETPDDVFAAISASASRARKPAAQAPTIAPAVATPAPAAIASERTTYADYVAHAAPSAPGAGMAAQLASSPFAPALRHVLALPSAHSFDVRALFGGSLSAAYLSGLFAPASHELEVASPMPAWASWSPALAAGDALGERTVPGFDPAYVAPELAPFATTSPAAISDATSDASEPFTAPAIGAPAFAPAAMELAPLTTLRSALLSWSTDLGPTGMPMGSMGPMTSATLDTAMLPQAPSQARSMVDTMSLPMVSETEASTIGGWTAPGAVADRAFGYSLAHERSTSDLSFDFVPPELVLAARVYGLGPAEAAQAMRLALAGPGQLTAMANAVDRTFVHAMAIDADRREGRAFSAEHPAGAMPAFAGAMPTGASAMPTSAMPTSAMPTGAMPTGAMPTAATPTMASMFEQHVIGSATHAAFGVDRRAPRGAFLWPAATVAALGLTAASPDGEQSMSVAALELLAAQAVAEIGTYAAFDDSPFADDHETATTADAQRSAPMSPVIPMVGAGAATADSSAAAQPQAAQGEPREEDVLGAANALVAPARRGRFDALYVALSQSPSGRSMSPAARAARALALAGRGDDAPTSAYERAAAVWDVLPVVYATEGMSTEEAVHTQAELGANTPRGIAARASLRRPGLGGGVELTQVESRPGLSSLSSRAGEALGSYVTSVQVPSTPMGATTTTTSTTQTSVGQRAPNAAQELVQTGRPSGRHGGGEPEIPPWFEAAARRMLGERMGTDTLSLAELTLVNAAPATQIAAASKTGAVSAAPATAPASAEGGGGDKKGGGDDVGEIADEVFKQILVMMDAARARNGEPYL